MNQPALRIYDFVLDRILLGKSAEGDLLPTQEDLASQFGVSRMHAHAAIRVLERHGIVHSKHRAGTFVRRRPSPPLARHLKGISATRVHVVVGFESVPLHWTEATVRQFEHLLGEDDFAVSHVPIPSLLTRDSLER